MVSISVINLNYHGRSCDWLKSKAYLPLMITPTTHRTTDLMELYLSRIFSCVGAFVSLPWKGADEEWDGEHPFLKSRIYLNGNINVSDSPVVFNVEYNLVCAYGLPEKTDQASNMDTRDGLLMDHKLHTDTKRKMVVLQSNGPVDRGLVKIEVEAVKVNIVLAIIPKTPSLFLVWASSRLWLELQWR